MEPLENKDEDLIEGKNKKLELSFGMAESSGHIIINKLKFGQTVYIVSYFPQSSGSSRDNPMMYITRNAHHEVVECRVVSSGNDEVYLHWKGFVKRSEVFVDKEHAEQKLKQLEGEKKNDSSESEQLHGGGRELL